MANKKTKKKHGRLKKTAARKSRPVKKAPKKKAAKKKAAPRKKAVQKKSAPKRVAVKAKPAGKKPSAKTARPTRKPVLRADESLDAIELQGRKSQYAGQSGDLQGLSDVERADSESVDELIEEGNAFEADVVAGVERAGNSDEEEVHTHEVPEDDVPEEYLDKD
jgi:hypothetical protein